jgi:hypothetical protein
LAWANGGRVNGLVRRGIVPKVRGQGRQNVPGKDAAFAQSESGNVQTEGLRTAETRAAGIRRQTRKAGLRVNGNVMCSIVPKVRGQGRQTVPGQRCGKERSDWPGRMEAA